MKAVAVTLSGVASVAATIGRPAVAWLAALALALLGVVCWIVSNQARTANTVALIVASRGNAPVTSPRIDGDSENDPSGRTQV